MSDTSSAPTFSTTEPRGYRYTFRLSEAERAYVEAKAERHGLTVAQLIRERLAGRVDFDDAPAPSGPTSDLRI